MSVMRTEDHYFEPFKSGNASGLIWIDITYSHLNFDSDFTGKNLDEDNNKYNLAKRASEFLECWSKEVFRAILTNRHGISGSIASEAL